MVLTADCPLDWHADLRLDGFETILADFTAAARAVSDQAATRFVTTDQALAYGLAGLARCLQIENPGAAVQIVLAQTAAAISQTLADELLVDARSPEAPLYRSFHLTDFIESWQPKGHIVVTGGNGTIARLLCQDILATGKANGLTLIGRNGPTAETAALLTRAAMQGVSADWISDPGADANSAIRLAAALADRRRLAGPITGVMHCAGVTADGLLASGNLPSLPNVLRAKLDIACDLDAATKEDPITVFAGFSSLASVAGNEGQGLYAFANGMLDGMLAARDAMVRQGLRHGQSLALNWGYWEQGGMRLGAQTLAHLQDRDGVEPIAAVQGLSALWAALGSGTGQCAIAAGDPDRIQTRLNRPAMPLALAQAAQVDPGLQQAVAQQLCAVLAAAGGRDPAEIDPIEPFSAYGVDSLMVVEVMQRLRPVFGDLPRAAMFEHGSVDRLALWLSQAHRAASLRWTGRAADARPTTNSTRCPATLETARSTRDARPDDIVPDDKEIVIVGMAGRFPGAANTTQLWQNLLSSHDAITDIPADRWDVDAMFHPDPSRAHAGFSYARWGGFLPDFADFDPSFFGMTPREAAEIDPQERLFLMTAWNAVEDAGLTPALMRERLGGAVGVFAGVTKSDHARLGARRHGDGSVVHPRASFSSVANRVSFVMDLHGPSVPVDTMCSSSMTALHQARMALLHGECPLALVGGVNLYQHPSSYAELCQSGMLAKDGRCRSFGAGGSGFVPGEGAACLVLTTRDVARRLGLRIDAVLRATAVNHGGTANGYTVPNPATQRALVENVLHTAGYTAKDIGLVEAHGTGTTLGDPIEVESLTGAFGPLAPATCALGSIKSNIGHLEAAAGVVGVIKVVMQLRHGRMVPTLNSTTPNPDIDFARSPFHLVHQVQAWTGPRRAVVNSFGAGGANGCALIEGVDAGVARDEVMPNLLILSARSRQALLAQAKQLLDWLTAQDSPATEGVRPLLAARLGLRGDDIPPEATLADLGLSADDLRWLALELGSDDLTPDCRIADLQAGRQVARGDLAAVCATLQIGRVAQPVRFACAVASVENAERALGALLAEPDTAGIVEITKADRNDLKRLQDHPEFARMMDTLLSAGDLPRLAGLWRRGVDLDWGRLYAMRPLPVSLPGTFFDCRRMWLGDLPLANSDVAARPSKPQLAELAPLVGASTASPLQDITGTLRRLLSQTMDLPEGDIHDSQSFADYGLDSILGIRFIDAINRALGCDIRSTAIFDFPTVQALAGLLVERGIKVPTLTQAIPAVAASAPVPAWPVQPALTPAQGLAAPAQGAIAIIGQSGRYAGADDLGQFWHNLMTGQAAVGPVTRWPLPDHVRCRTGGFLSGIDRFDAGFFNISGSEARYMDPQQRVFLEESWVALEQAGYVGAAITGQRCGVYIGCYTGDYQDLFIAAPSPQSLWGNMGSVIPARIAYHLDLRGPALSFDTACSSSLVAVDAACKALRRGDVDMALAGGVFLQATPRLYLAAERAGMLSPTGQSYSFDARADGFVPGEGVGVVVLKRLADALAAGDMILATIEGSAVNSNGKTNGLIAPSTKAQAALLAEAQADAGVTPREIAMIEAHGTGTALGDPIEFDALAQVFGASRSSKVALTSVKPAIGHAQFAAGIASLHKVVLSLQHGMIPANLCFDRVNPLVDLAGAGFDVPVASRPWPQEGPRLAGVSSFGASGTNAHVILRAAPVRADGLYHAAAYPILLSARSVAGLRGLVAKFADFVDANPDAVLGDVAFTLIQGRMHFERRCGFAVRSLAELSQHLRRWLLDETEPTGEFGDLIAAFVQGGAPRWSDLFPQDRPRRIAVPGAVFERAHYWVDAPQSLPEAPAALLLPIFDLTRIDQETVGVKIASDNAMMRDHQVNGASVLPGFALPELFRQVLERIEDAPVLQMKVRDLCWLRPVDTAAFYDLRVQIGDESASGRAVRLITGKTVLAQAHILRAVLPPTPLAPLTGGKPVSTEAIADRLRAGGIQHGPSLRGVQAVLRADGNALAHLADPSGKPLPLSPALLDSAVQAAVAFSDGVAKTLPFSVAEITLLHPATARMDARLTAPRAMAAGTLGGLDIDLCLPDGRVAISLRGIAARPIPALAAVTDQQSTTQALVPRWHHVTLEAGVALPPEVVFYPDGAEVPGYLWPATPRANLRAVADWAHVNRIGLWVGTPCTPLVAAEKSLQAEVLALVQTLLRNGAEARSVDWTVLTCNALHHADMPASGYGASLVGLFGAMGREYRGWTLRMADLDASEIGPELSCLPDRRMLMRRSGLWLEQRLDRLSQLPVGPSPYRDGAVYVVIGGAGGVGRIWTEHVLRTSRAQVIWLGRSAPDSPLLAHQNRLATHGPRPAYVQVDARDAVALAAARADIIRQYGRIDGVVHSAITLADGGLAGMDWPRMDAVLSAKLETLDNMLSVFSADMRDFAVVFSSLQSFARMPGQANYAAACTFADNHALETAARRSMPLRVVNWGYWAEAGIVATEGHRRRMARFGQLGLDPERALSALDALLTGGPVQMAIAELQTGATVTMEAETATSGASPLSLAQGIAPPLLSRLSTRDAGDRWRPIHARLGAQMDRFDPEMTDVLASCVAEAGLTHPAGRANMRGLPGIFDKWWAETARVLTAAGYLDKAGLPARAALDLGHAWANWERATAAVADEPDLRDHVRLASAMLRGLPDIMAGTTPATQFMFPEGRFDLVNGVYHGNCVADFFNDLLADAIVSAVQARIAEDPAVRLRLVEVGAGTGGTARVLFRRLAPFAANIEEYRFTDVSKAFLITARQKFLKDAPYLQTQIFDVSNPPQDQGFAAGSYDIAVATNVLHATHDILQSLSHTKALLRQNGLLLVNELICKSLFSHLTFGLLEGWWAYDDAAMRLPGTPALASDRWCTVLSLAGFRPVTRLCPEAEVLTQQVFIGQSDGVIEVPPAIPEPVAANTGEAQHARIAAAVPTPQIDLCAYLRQRLATAIEVDADRIEDDAPFERYGVDSILVLQIVDFLRVDFPKLTSTVLFESNTIARLALHLRQAQPEAVAALPQPTMPVAPPPAGNSAATMPPAATQSATMHQPRMSIPQVAAPGSRDVAIIGLAGSFAGTANLDELWAAVASGETLFRPAPVDARHWPADMSLPAGYMEGADRFDPLFFAISPAEAMQMDPQERLFLQTAYHAMENAGYAPQTLSRQWRVAVLAGVMNAHYPTRAAFWSVANRLSFLFDFKGPSLSCDTACSSSAAALVLAMDMLRAGRCDVAIAGGVNVISHPRHLASHVALGIQSRQGRLRPFSADADGMLSGEGAGVVILKMLDRAQADGDKIEGILRGAALGSGGRSSSYTAPSPSGHDDVITQALADAGVAPQAISLIEAHGTGTRLGDPIEVEGLTRALGPQTRALVGSVKANIGHAESAAAMAGLFKVLAQMRHETIAPLPNLGRINPEIPVNDTLSFPREPRAWPRVEGQTRLAGLSSFGAGGANAHLVVQEPPVARARPAPSGVHVVPLSARSDAQLRQMAQNLLAHLAATKSADLADIAYTLQTGRDAFDHRWAFSGVHIAALEDALREFLAGTAASPTNPLAQEWLAGAKMDWASLWAAPLPQRLALPVYPFATESYWLAEATIAAPALEMPPQPASGQTALAILCQIVGETLGIAHNHLDVTAPLDGYGLDSVMITRATDRLEAVFGPLPKTLFYEFRSLAALGAYLDETHALPIPAQTAPAAEPAAMDDLSTDAIAIIGLSGRYPQAETLEHFWQVLTEGRDCITPIPAERWDHSRFYSDTKATGKTRSRWGGFLNGIDGFDAAFFGILPKDADLTDPQERLFVETAWHAVEDAGHSPESLTAGGRVGVFVGVMYSEYQLLAAEQTALGQPTALSSSPASIANRVSYLFDFQGPSLAVDTMCASSLTAIHLAVRALRAGECHAAVAGGVNLSLHPNKYLMMGLGGFEATDGRCRSFGDGGSGYVPSEGVGAVVLKPLSRALADGDPIRGIIRGTAINHGGRSNGYTVPDPVAQATTISDALADGGVAPAAISYVECHGTGTALGDPIEIAGLKRIFGRDHVLGLGSVKSNIGHCESAAGIAGLTKVLLQMQHRQRVSSLHSSVLNPDLGIHETAFHVDQVPTPWVAASGHLMAGVSSFGAGGSNAHLVIEEPPAPRAVQGDGPVALVLSARSDEQLAAMATALAARLERNRPALLSVAYTLQTGRRALPQRAGVMAENLTQAVAALRSLAGNLRAVPESGHQQAVFLRRWLAGERVDWASLYPVAPPRVQLPLYPFDRKSYWGVPRPVSPVTENKAPTGGDAFALFSPVWSPDTNPSPLQVPNNRLVVDLTGQLTESEVSCLSLPLTSPEDVASALVARLGPVMGQTRVPELVQFALPADAGALVPALAAFAGTMAQERRTLRVQVVELARAWPAGGVRTLLEQASANPARLIRMTDSGNLVRHLAPLDLPDQPAPVPQGMVIISGGLGGLGQVFAADIARGSPDTPILLLGRRPRDGGIDAELARLGARRIAYRAVDITDADAVAQVLASARTEFGPISLVIHSAGILRDGMLMVKSPADARAVVATKAAGARTLDAATRQDPLTGFVLCSSLAGVSGNAGQGDYAIGNGWMDGFAAARRGPGRTVSLNWPLWAEGGMTVPESALHAMRQDFGLAPMPDAEGVSLLWRALGSDARQVVVGWGEPDRITETLDNGSARRAALAPVPHASTPQKTEASSFLADLTALLADVLRIPASEVQTDVQLADYGFDSIALADLADQCTTRLGIAVSPALFYSFGTLRQVSAHLGEEVALAGPPPSQPPAEAMPIAPTVVSAPVPVRSPAAPEPDDAVAIVGVSAAFPGAGDVEAFWQNLKAGRRAITEIPPDRWDWRALMGDPKSEAGKTDIRWGGFLDDIAGFDPLFFGISPREAECMDPHQRLLLTHAWRAIEDAGIAPAALSGSNTAVFMATSASEYAAMARESGVILQQLSPSGVVGSLGPNRLSHLLNLGGPSEPVETACSSALVALHRAVEAIRAGCDGAIVGAVNTILMPHGHVSFARSGMLSPEGECRSFAADANGYVRSEGVAVLVLRRLSDAQRDGLPILGVIRATGVNHCGRGISLFAPNADAQARLIADVLGQSGLDPASLTAIEAHGTGTSVGDPIEVEGLKRGFQTALARHGSSEPAQGQIALSSVKSWIGHCEVSAGMAGLIKLLMELRDEVLIPDAPRTAINPAIQLAGTPFRLLDGHEPWRPLLDSTGKGLPRRAGISSFGFGGVNAHAVIEEAPPEAFSAHPSTAPEVIVLSAQSAQALRATGQALLGWLQARPETSLTSLATTLQMGRNALRHRMSLVARSIHDVCDSLSAFVENRADGRWVQGIARQDGAEPALATDPAELAQAWVKGHAVTWPQRPMGLARLRLPITAMDIRRCWFAPQDAPVTAPRLMARNDHDSLRYDALFDGGTDFVRDHLVQGQPVLPGTAYVAMAHDSGFSHLGTTALSIHDLTFEHMAHGALLSPPLHLHLQSGTEVGFQIESTAGIHARGRILAQPSRPARHIDLAALDAQVTERIAGKRFYETFARMGLDYGPSFRLIDQAGVGGGFVLTRLRQLDGAPAWPLPPNLVDAALQSSLGFVLQQYAGPIPLQVPVKIDTVDIYAPLPTEVVVVAEQSNDHRRQVTNIALCGRDGTVFVELRGFVTARVGMAPPRIETSPTAPKPQQATVLQARLQEVVSELTHIAVSDLDVRADLVEFGLDSITFHELSARLSAELQRDIAPSLFFECPTIAALAERLALSQAVAPVAAALPKQDGVLKVVSPEPLENPAAKIADGAMQAAVLGCIAQILHLAPSEVALETGLSEIGLDSITFAELASQLSVLLGTEVSPAALYECATVGALVDRFGPESVPPAPSQSIPKAAAILPTLVSAQPIAAPTGSADTDGFAIIGMSGAFPGAADPETLWRNMIEGRDVITRPPSWRWDWQRIDGDPRQAAGQTNIHWGGFIDGLADFDPAFFGLSTAETEIIDPQHRLMMMHVWAALEAAGHAPRGLGGSKTGLYMGLASASYAMMVGRAGRSTDPRWVMGNVVSMGLNRISHMLDLHGPSEPCETACSSSLVALHRGVEDLRSGVCDMIVAGGVNAMPNEDLHVAFSAAGMLSPDGRCKTFDKKANGYVRGEGIGVVVVRRLADALRDGDGILAVIRATGVRHAGRAVSLTAPNPQSQASLIQEVIDRAGIDPSTISFIEAHGTGTALGDPIEVEGLKTAFDAARTANPLMPGFCAIGAVKTHVGHLEMAAGVTGLIKVLLQMRHRQIIGNLYCSTVNPLLRLEGSPFRLAQTTTPWAPRDAKGQPLPLRAGVSSFGFGGVNAHVLLDGPPDLTASAVDLAPQAVILSAATETALRAQAQRLCDWIETQPDATTTPGLLARIAVTLQDGRDAMAHRLALVVQDVTQLVDSLRAWLTKQPVPASVGIWSGHTQAKPSFLQASDLAVLQSGWAQHRNLACACEAWAAGLAIDWAAFRLMPQRKLSLPTYPFDCKPYWVTPLSKAPLPVTVATALLPQTPAHGDVGIEDTLRRIAAEYHGVDAADLDLDAPLAEHGFDSIALMTVVSRLTAALPDLTLGDKADLLLQSSNLRMMADRAAGPDRDETPEKPELLPLDLYAQGQKKDPLNLVITRPVLHLGKSPRSTAGLVIDETHPLFFDHQLDHVSGLQLAEAICQLTRATELCHNHHDPQAAVFIRQLRFDFPAICAKQPAEVSVRPDPARPLGYRGEVRQAGVVVAQGQLVFGSMDGLPDASPPDNAMPRRLRKGRVNKTHADNVLLAGLAREEGRLRALLSVAPKAGFYNDFVGPSLDGIVLLEAVRQVMRAISTEEATTGDKSRLGLLRQLEVTLNRPIRRDEAVEFSAGTEGSMVVGGAALLSVQGDILAPGTGQRIGRFSTLATQITEELQRAWSQSMTGTRDWNA